MSSLSRLQQKTPSLEATIPLQQCMKGFRETEQGTRKNIPRVNISEEPCTLQSAQQAVWLIFSSDFSQGNRNNLKMQNEMYFVVSDVFFFS